MVEKAEKRAKRRLHIREYKILCQSKGQEFTDIFPSGMSFSFPNISVASSGTFGNCPVGPEFFKKLEFEITLSDNSKFSLLGVTCVTKGFSKICKDFIVKHEIVRITCYKTTKCFVVLFAARFFQDLDQKGLWKFDCEA